MSSPESISIARVLREAITVGAVRGNALTDGRFRVPYAELEARLAQWEAFLAHSGVTRDRPVVLECTTSVPGLLTLLALLRGGTSFALLPPSARAETPPPRFCSLRLRVHGTSTVEPDGLPRPEHLLEISPIAGAHAPPAGEASAPERLFVRTSGSLGVPKLVVHTHEGLLGNALNCIERLRLREDDRICVPVPLAHMFGLGAAVLPALAVGANLDLLEGASLPRFLEREERTHPTVTFLTPHLCAMVLRRRTAPVHYRQAVIAGDRMTPELFASAQALFQHIINLYGCTELGAITAVDPEAGEEPRATSVGRALPDVRIQLRPLKDSDEGEGEPPGTAGELWCHHPFAFQGYLDEDGHPWRGEPFVEDGWYRTRDLCLLHEEGTLEVLGRTDLGVKRDGRLLMLTDIEGAVQRVCGVERAVAVLGSQGLRGRRLIVFCVPREGQSLEPARVRATCLDLLPGYALPDEVRLLSTLPLLPSGKVDRQALRALAMTPPSALQQGLRP
ncbi:Long-chain-fatty-acid--CoA ligase [Cystobacter fuscus DSM 2262]|uniref:Long-chain-fatty-acid--CoA ligase n=1 Tax=Cystobacter fuscus (strain ATCC 25194 / DSM 2262 / NBRC 100088 / M29) TaxID=1242864 RepID=S9QN22_CYSF2|nr:fatty acid--CoA ligase family protein [Cystobacter fuscus]EPX62654.1 Long-chain-fatty-acid--CoA ligase [Cystobacter fuscus DSM 2262]